MAEHWGAQLRPRAASLGLFGGLVEPCRLGPLSLFPRLSLVFFSLFALY